MTSELNSEISDINTNIGDYTTANFMRILSIKVPQLLMVLLV